MLVWWTEIQMYRFVRVCPNRRRPVLLFQWSKSEIYREARIQVSVSYFHLIIVEFILRYFFSTKETTSQLSLM